MECDGYSIIGINKTPVIHIRNFTNYSRKTLIKNRCITKILDCPFEQCIPEHKEILSLPFQRQHYLNPLILNSLWIDGTYGRMGDNRLRSINPLLLFVTDPLK